MTPPTQTPQTRTTQTRTTQTRTTATATSLDQLKGAVNHALATGASACSALAFAAAAAPLGGLDRLAGFGLVVVLSGFAALNALRLRAVRRGSHRYDRAVRTAAAITGAALVLWGAAFFF